MDVMTPRRLQKFIRSDTPIRARHVREIADACAAAALAIEDRKARSSHRLLTNSAASHASFLTPKRRLPISYDGSSGSNLKLRDRRSAEWDEARGARQVQPIATVVITPKFRVVGELRERRADVLEREDSPNASSVAARTATV